MPGRAQSITGHDPLEREALGAPADAGSCAELPDVRLIIASSVRLVREGLALSLNGRDNLVVIDAVSLDPPGLARITAAAPDVLLVDLAKTEARSTAALLKTACPQAKLIAFALAEIEDDVFACAAAGFAGYVPRESGAEDMSSIVLNVVRGRMHCAPHITAAMFSRLSILLRDRQMPAVLPSLTSRECEILRLAEEGRSNKEIARRLSISGATVKNHMHNILQKLQVSRRGEAAALLRACREN